MRNGVDSVLYIKIEEVWTPIGCLISNSFSETSDMLPTTTRDNLSYETSRPTRQGYNISFSGLITDGFSYKSLQAIKRARNIIDWKIDDEEGQGLIVSLSDTANIDEFISFSGEILGLAIPINECLDSYVLPEYVDCGYSY